MPAKDITPIVEPDIVSVPAAPPISVLVKLISEGLLLEKFNKFGVVNLTPLAFSKKESALKAVPLLPIQTPELRALR